MLKRDLINQVAEHIGAYYKQDIALVVDIILEEMAQALVEERRVEIRGFGSFAVRTRKPRTTKNPKTGNVMHIPTRKTLHFTMSKSLKEVLIDDEKE
jgi:integration host factor subunit beta